MPTTLSGPTLAAQQADRFHRGNEMASIGVLAR
jgi:hypothetical protein